MVYRAKREPIVVGVVVVDVIACVAAGTWFVWGAATGRMPWPMFVMGPSLVASSLFATWILLKSTYEIDNGELIVRQGPNRKRYPLSSIDEISPTQGLPPSPAWAAGRLQVRLTPGTKPGTLFLQPEDRSGFLQALSEADPGLRYDGERLTRGAPA